MSAKKILNQHFKVIFNDKGERACQCGFYLGNHDGMSKRHKKHAIAVLEQHMQEREARAWSAGFHKGRKTENGSHLSTWPKNPYRKEATDGS